jgi:hypothetical protein
MLLKCCEMMTSGALLARCSNSNLLFGRVGQIRLQAARIDVVPFDAPGETCVGEILASTSVRDDCINVEEMQVSR